MYCPTANSAASIRFTLPEYQIEPENNERLKEQYKRWSDKFSEQLSDNKPESFIFVTSPIEPSWLEATKRRVRKSVIPANLAEENDGRWITQEIADSAIDFFSKTADLISKEPFIYSSSRGDLIAEFKTQQNTLTCIVSPTFIVLFAVVNGKPIEIRITESTKLRKEFGKLATVLSTG